MALQIITDEANFDSIRRLVGVTITEGQLPNELIADDVYAGAAEAAVIASVPNWSGLTTEQQDQIRLAVMTITAANIIEAMPQIASEKYNDETTVSVKWMSIERRIASLRDRASGIIDGIIGQPRSSKLAHFAVAPARRTRGF